MELVAHLLSRIPAARKASVLGQFDSRLPNPNSPTLFHEIGQHANCRQDLLTTLAVSLRTQAHRSPPAVLHGGTPFLLRLKFAKSNQLPGEADERFRCVDLAGQVWLER